MKQLLLIGLLASLTAPPVFAKDRQPQEYIEGSKCGLFDDWGDVTEDSTTYDLSRSSRRAKYLNKIVQKQLIAAAKHENSNANKITDATAATDYLRENSEGQEVYILRVNIKSKKYSVISYYGGGNHTGYIFPWGSTNIVGLISDDNIICAK